MDSAHSGEGRDEVRSIHPEEQKSILENPNIPLETKVLNLDASKFEKSEYADGKYRLKDLNILRELAPGVYESVADEVKEYSAALFETKGQFRKYNLGRKVGSIPLMDMTLNPELAWDHAAQDKYFQEHPELKTKDV